MKVNNKAFRTGYLAMIASVLCFALVETIGSLIFEKGGSPLTLLTGRALIAVIIFGVMILASQRLSFKVRTKDLLLLVVAGLFLTFMLIAFWYGLKLLGHVGVHLSLFLLHPVFMVFLAIPLFKEPLTKRKLSSLGLGVLGVPLVLKIIPDFQSGNFEFSILGVTCSILAGLLMAGFMFSSQKLLRNYHFSQLLFYNYLIAFGVFLLFQNPSLTLTEISIPFIWKAVLFLGVFSTCLAYALQQIAVKRIGAATSAIIKLAKPVLSGAFAFLILGQTMTPLQSLGGSLIVAGVYLIRRQ